MIKNPNSPSSLVITDLGFNFPWASVLLVLKSKDVQIAKGRFQKKKKLVEISTKGWVGGSGGGQFPLKKNKKNMPLKSILGHFKPF